MQHQLIVLVEFDGDGYDVYTVLANKERDLLLAAELGKELLEKNEELKKKNDTLVEDYTKRIEVSGNMCDILP